MGIASKGCSCFLLQVTGWSGRHPPMGRSAIRRVGLTAAVTRLSARPCSLIVGGRYSFRPSRSSRSRPNCALASRIRSVSDDPPSQGCASLFRAIAVFGGRDATEDRTGFAGDVVARRSRCVPARSKRSHFFTRRAHAVVTRVSQGPRGGRQGSIAPAQSPYATIIADDLGC